MHLTKTLISSSVYGIPLSLTGTPYSSMQHSNGKLLSPNFSSPMFNGRSIPSFFSAIFRSCRLPHRTKSFSFSSESLDVRAERLRDRQIVTALCGSCTHSQGSILSRHWAREVSIVRGKRIGVLPLGASASSTRSAIRTFRSAQSCSTTAIHRSKKLKPMLGLSLEYLWTCKNSQAR